MLLLFQNLKYMGTANINSTLLVLLIVCTTL